MARTVESWLDIQTRMIKALKKAGKPLDDGELAAVLGINSPHVNQAARRLQGANAP